MEVGENKEMASNDKPKVLLMDLGKVLLYSTEKGHKGKLNPRHQQLMQERGNSYNFFQHFGVNEELLGLLAELKDDYTIYMITEGNIQDYSQLKEKLETAFNYDNIISTGRLELDKTKPEAYEYVIGKLGLNLNEILFVDDSSDNTNAASEAGLQVLRYTSEDQTVSELKRRLEIREEGKKN